VFGGKTLDISAFFHSCLFSKLQGFDASCPLASPCSSACACCMLRASSQKYTLPPALSSTQDGLSEGLFLYPLPFGARAVRESQRDFLRTLVAGGITFLTPALFEAVWRRTDRPCSKTGKVHGVVPGDVSDEAVQAAIADFREQLLDTSFLPEVSETFLGSASNTVLRSSNVQQSPLHEDGESTSPRGGGACGGGGKGGPSELVEAPTSWSLEEKDDVDEEHPRRRVDSAGRSSEGSFDQSALYAMLKGAVESGLVEPQLTVGPALQFTIDVGLQPRILQPRFVVVIGLRSLRVATVGFVGEPIIGDRPSEQRTPFVVRLLTQNLLEIDTAGDREGGPPQIRVRYCVRNAQAAELSAQACLKTEVDELREMADGRRASWQPLLAPDFGQGLVAGVSLLGSVERGDEEITFFRVKVAPSSGREPWEVERRYQQFHDLFRTLRPARGQLGVSFPRKHLRVLAGDRLETRRRGLEVWLGEVVREAQSRMPSWLRHIYDFLEVPG